MTTTTTTTTELRLWRDPLEAAWVLASGNVPFNDPVEAFHSLTRFDDDLVQLRNRVAQARRQVLRKLRGADPRPTFVSLSAVLGVSAQRLSALAAEEEGRRDGEGAEAG